MTTVSVCPRVIAGGIHAGPKGRTLRITLALMPVASNPARAQVALEAWPRQIEALIADTQSGAGGRGWRLLIAPARSRSGERPVPSKDGLLEVDPRLVRADTLLIKGKAGKALEDADALWRWIMSAGAGVSSGLWPELADVITEAGNAAARAKSEALGVAASGRAEAALVLTSARARKAAAAASDMRTAGPAASGVPRADPFTRDHLGEQGGATPTRGMMSKEPRFSTSPRQRVAGTSSTTRR